jgi:hypothetical protein
MENLLDALFHFIDFIEDTTILRTRFSTAKFWSFSKVLPVKVEYISAGVAGYAQLWTDA